MKRVFWIVLDSVGLGGAPEAAELTAAGVSAADAGQLPDAPGAGQDRASARRSWDEIKADYTLTSFSTSGIRTAKAFDHMAKKAFKSKPATSFNEKIEAFARECGFTADDIAKFRRIMLD